MDTFESTSDSASPPLGRAIALALAILAAVVIGTYFVATTSDSATEVQTAVPDDASTEPVDEPDAGDQDPAGGDEGEGSSSSDTTAEPPPAVETEPDRDLPASSGFDEQAAGDGGFGGGSGEVVHGPGGFGSLRWSNTGLVARRSGDGLTWTETPATGLPDEAGVRMLTVSGDRYVAVLEQHPEYDEGDEPFFFEGTATSTYHLATSTDLVDWTTSILPVVDPPVVSEYGTSVFIADAAVGDSGLVAVYTTFPHPPNDLQLLSEAGVLDESDFETYCGLSWESFEAGEPVSIYSCDYVAFEEAAAELEERMAAAESDAEIENIEGEFERFEPERIEIAQVEPGTELYDQLREANLGMERPDIAVLVMAGPIGGPYTTNLLGETGNPSGIVATDDGYVLLMTEFGFESDGDESRSSSTILRSSDGQTWGKPQSVSTSTGLWGIEAAGSVVVSSGGTDEGDPLTYVSTDGGATWRVAPEFGRDLYGAWVTAVGGPAGMALWVEGSTEPYPEYPPFVLSVDKGGYVLELILEENLLFLTGPDGDVIHELTNLDELIGGSGGVPGVVREDPDDVVTFLDPETGEDLVSFSEEDLELAYQENEELTDYAFEEPPRARELWFSADGNDWSMLEPLPIEEPNSYPQLAAVGDDEILVSVTTWLEPPTDLFAFEFEERDPTDAEIEAIDAWYADNDGGSLIEWTRIPVG